MFKHRKLRNPGLTALIIIFTFGFAFAATKHLPTFDDLMGLKEIEALSLSPNAGWVAYAYDGGVWIASTTGDPAPRKIAEQSMFPVWAPDNKHLAYYSGEPAQLWVFDILSNHTEQVTNLDGGIRPSVYTAYIGARASLDEVWHYGWSPDSSEIVFPSQVEVSSQAAGQNVSDTVEPTQQGAPLILDDKTPPIWTMSGIFRSGGFAPNHREGGKVVWNSESPARRSPVMTNQLLIVNIQQKTVRQLTRDTDVYFEPEWSPDGREIVCASPEGRPLVGARSGPSNIYVFDALTGDKRPLTRNTRFNRAPQWSPDGRTIAYLSWDRGAPQHAFTVAASGGTPVDATRQLDRDVYIFTWMRDSTSLQFIYWDGPSSPIAIVNIQSTDITPLGKDHPAARLFMANSRVGTFVWVESDEKHKDVIYMRRASLAPRLVLDINPQVQNWALGDQVVVYWKNSRGERLSGILIKPVGYQAGKKYPLLVDCYPGLENGFKGDPMSGNQTWAARGYAVFWPVSRAPHVLDGPYRETSFGEAAQGSKGLAVMADDILSGIDELAQEGIADPDRMALYGISNGGGVVNDMIVRTDRFKCAVSIAAAWSADWIMPFFTRTEPKMLPSIVGSLPWEKPQEYVALSAIFHLDRVQTPVLLIAGDDDGWFLMEAIEMYNGLRYLHKNVKLFRYPNQGHIFYGPALRDFSDRVTAYVDDYLRPAPPSRSKEN